MIFSVLKFLRLYHNKPHQTGTFDKINKLETKKYEILNFNIFLIFSSHVSIITR